MPCSKAASSRQVDVIRVLRMVVPMALLGLSLLLPAGVATADDYYSERSSWDRFGGGNLNISSFAFRDINRNGLYDMADRPMAGIAFEVVGGGRTVTRRTNKSGYANFSMSVLDRSQDILDGGEYLFRAMIPQGWILTTDNATQRTSFDLMPGAPADMISSTPLQPVGLAQELTISGTVTIPATATDGRVLVRAISPTGEQQERTLDQTGSFSFEAIPGSWVVLVENGEGEVLSERRIEVSASPVVLATLVPGEPRRDVTEPSTVVGFDDLVITGIKEVPSGYHRLSWQHWVVTHQKFYDGEGYVNSSTSGEFVGYNSSGHPATISYDRPFDFIGGFFGSAWLQAEGETLRVKGWRGALLVYDETIKVSALGPIYFAADFHDVTRLEFSTGMYWQFVGDDLEFVLPN
jgi:hypothetical protein